MVRPTWHLRTKLHSARSNWYSCSFFTCHNQNFTRFSNSFLIRKRKCSIVFFLFFYRRISVSRKHFKNNINSAAAAAAQCRKNNSIQERLFKAFENVILDYTQTWGGISFPGFMISLGSKTDFILFIVRNAPIPSSFSRYCNTHHRRAGLIINNIFIIRLH